ncbi:hypothetical protein [Pontiella sp.]|uniref:hypothetical protein n=1 Tax=Pontiella sp. TaxID=2837462 RepID=UPI003565519C
MKRILSGVMCLIGTAAWAGSGIVDSIQFGHSVSEQAHQLQAENSEIAEGALGLKVRRLLPRDDHRWRGGTAAFEMAVDPDEVNYCTVKLWGGDTSKDSVRLMLFIDGKQVGQRHLGEVEQLDVSGPYPRFEGLFYYHTFPLPLKETQGKKKVALAIELQGGIWAYGQTFDRFQPDLKEPSRGLYRMYTHTDPFFEPAADERQGGVLSPPVRPADDAAGAVEKVKARINQTLADLLSRKDDRFTQEELGFMARAYHEPWSAVYQSPELVERIVGGIDNQYLHYLGEQGEFEWKKTWFGFGYSGDAVRYLAKELKPFLDRPIRGKTISRKEGWAKMFVASRDGHVVNRRSYTNQSMIWDMYSIYLCNRALAVVDPRQAWPEKEAVQFMYESMGLEPWSGSRKSPDGEPTWSMGRAYLQLTEAGLTKELGYVGAYGEVLDLVCKMYDATRPAYGQPGDARLKEQVIKIARARAAFRYPSTDPDGYRAMRMEAVVGWRDFKYPGQVAYGQGVTRESIPCGAAAATLDPVMIGYAQQLFEDRQFGASVKEVMKNNSLRTSLALLDVPHTYETILAQPEQPTRLPMAPGQPDVVFADPENGVVAVKNGDEILYASLYWRARYAVNHLARVHYMTPTIERSATVLQETRFKDSGHVHRMKDRVNGPFFSKFERDYKEAGELGERLATAGVEQPIAVVPETYPDYEPGRENIFAGKGTFYLLAYGDYLIAMNCTADETFDFEVPAGFAGAKDLVSDRRVEAKKAVVKPRQTMVLYRTETF